ncbi:MAG: methyltransferase domain-containing protein [Candidatus Helarchaeota archaeon]|nr:methyltransferase domain-containing protein [Candidatus Helarchaeota archaeon]
MSKSKKVKKKYGPEYLFSFVQTFYELLVIASGIELNLYDLINQHKSISSKKLSSLKNYSENLINSWCNAATAIGHLKLEKTDYSLSKWAKNFLCKDSPSYLGFIFQNMEGLFFIYNTLKKRFNGHYPPITGSHAVNIIKSIAPLANLIVPILRNEIPRLNEKCEFLDLGCGLGSYLVLLAKLNPHLQGTGIEGGWGLEVVNEARKYIKQNNMENRIKIINADILNFKPEQKFDVIFMSGSIQAFQEKDAQKILNNSYSWLKKQGTIAIQEIIIDENRLGPQPNALFDFYLHLASPNAGLYSYQELYSMLKNAGFIEIKKYDIISGLSHIIAKNKI